MADIEITRPHALGLEGARVAAREMQEELSRKFGLAGSWQGDTLHFERSGASGKLTLGADAVHLSITLGFMLKAMKASIETSVHHELDRVFSGSRRA